MCPFSLKAAQEIQDLVPFFKIGSGEMTDIPSLLEIAKLGHPMIYLLVCQISKKLIEPIIF